MLRGKLIWSGGEWCDRQAGMPDVYDTWKRLFGEHLVSINAVETRDAGDAEWCRMPNGYVVKFACDGDSIFEPASEPS